MEATLNFLWLVITLAALWLWRFRWSVSRQDCKHRRATEAVAMVCILALLFPVISLTDDLHPETVAVDAASGKRDACLVSASAAHAHASSLAYRIHLSAGIISRPPGAFKWLFSQISEFPKGCELSNSARRLVGRSPPLLS